MFDISRWLIIFLPIFVVEIRGFENFAEGCSSFCNCDLWYGLRRASCTSRHLYSIESGLAGDFQALDLHDNSISTLVNSHFADVGLAGLKYLNLSQNTISEIGLGAFNGLSNLTVMDLSKNHLYYLLPELFLETKNLRVLKLSENNFDRTVPQLQSLSLTDLMMDRCKISHIPFDVFDGLPQLRNLDISNNLMIQLDVHIVRSLHFLKKISLTGNTWSCNAAMHDVLAHLQRKKVEYDHVCNNTTKIKMFEKMIIEPTRKLDKNIRHRQTSNKATKSRNVIDISKNNVPTNENIIKNTIYEQKPTCSYEDKIAPYWFFTAGLFLGSAITLMLCYLWLSIKTSCCARNIAVQNDSQRISLLQNLWYFEDSIANDVTNRTVSCPGTPPPPYRDVMLRPGLFPSPPPDIDLTNNHVIRNV